MRIDLPWPDKRLSPNARLHWAAVSTVKKIAREAACVLTAKAIPTATRVLIAQSEGPIALAVTFYPPDRRHRDDDNMVGAFKAYRDGIADALGVNDRRFRPHYFFEDAAKPGKVVVEIGDNSQRPSECAPAVLENERAGSLRKQLPGPDHTVCKGDE